VKKIALNKLYFFLQVDNLSAESETLF